MKTPEQMAEEYADRLWESPKYYQPEWIEAKKGFLAGYQAAKDEMNSPEKLDSSNSSNNSNGWISVKERLPEEGQDCIFYVDFIDKWDKGSERINFQEIGVFNGKDRFYHRSHTDLDRVTYWMPLPKSPEEA